MNYLIEIATADFATTRLAVEGGADRIELCADLGQGGTTASLATIRKCRETFSLPLFPIIRPRGGDFLYSEEEFFIMMEEVAFCRALGCDAVVLGLLDRDGSIDRERTARLVEKAFPMEVTFHRAFDRCREPFEALETLIQLGCSRILTSGQKLTAGEGSALIAALVRQSAGRIGVMPGSGIRPENIREIAQATGAAEFHASLRSRKKSTMDFIHPSFRDSEESYTNPYIDPAQVRALKEGLASLEQNH